MKPVAYSPVDRRKYSLRFVTSLASVIALCVLTLAQASPQVHLDAAKLGPRPIEEVTGTAIARSYAQAWRDLEASLQSDRTDGLGEEFVGAALDGLIQRIAEQKQTGVRVRIVDHGHNLKAVFYSTDGTAMQLLDQAQIEIQTFDGDKLLDTQTAPHEYVVIMTPGADRWYVRNLEEVSAESVDTRQ